MLLCGRKIHCNIRLGSVAQSRKHSRCSKTQLPMYNTKLPLPTWKRLGSNRLNFYYIKHLKMQTSGKVFCCLCRTPDEYSWLLQLSLLMNENLTDWIFENSHNQIPSGLQSYQCPHWLLVWCLKGKQTQKFCCLRFFASIASRIGCLFAVYLWRSSSISRSIIGSKAFSLICNSSKLRFFNCKTTKTIPQKILETNKKIIAFRKPLIYSCRVFTHLECMYTYRYNCW